MGRWLATVYCDQTVQLEPRGLYAPVGICRHLDDYSC